MKTTLLLLAFAGFLGACGVKPNSVDGAPGHPQTYPDMRTDPLPRDGAGHTIQR
ncbi:MAG: hypothetical protein ACLFR0_02850 [Alphaproteobacteria bacterium]